MQYYAFEAVENFEKTRTAHAILYNKCPRAARVHCITYTDYV